MNRRLKEIADVRTGYQFRREVQPDPKGNVRVIQIKDIEGDRRVRLDDLVTVRMDRPDPSLTEEGDVLFLARGHRLFAVVVPETVKDTIATGYFFVLRLRTSQVDPHYLAWYLNGREFQEALRPYTRGTHMPLVSKTDFQELTVPVPPLGVQHRILELAELRDRERRLVAEIEEKRSAMVDAVSRRAAHQGTPTQPKGSRTMAERIRQEDINGIVWRACDTFRGAVDPSEYKNYILTMLFIRYMSDLWKDRKHEYETRYKGDVERVSRALARERFVLPEGCDFDNLYKSRDAAKIGELINEALEQIEDANKAKLENVVRDIDFNSEPALGQTIERNRRLKLLLEDFANPRLDLTPSHLASRDVIGNVYMSLIEKFAAGAGKKAGEFYTPQEVSKSVCEKQEFGLIFAGSGRSWNANLTPPT